DDPMRVFAWLLDKTIDATGQRSVYEYARDHPGLYTGEASGFLAEHPSEHNRAAAQLYIRRIYYGNLPDPLVDDGGTPITYPDGSPVGHLRSGHRYAFEVVFDYGDWDEPTIDPHPEPPPDGQQELFGAPGASLSGARAVPVRPD